MGIVGKKELSTKIHATMALFRLLYELDVIDMTEAVATYGTIDFIFKTLDKHHDNF